jgi:hypothetical protein
LEKDSKFSFFSGTKKNVKNIKQKQDIIKIVSTILKNKIIKKIE